MNEIWLSYSLLQKISFILAIIGTFLFVIYLVLIWAGYYNLKRSYISDDIDMPNEVNETFVGFMLSSLAIRGSIIILAFGGWAVFAFSFFMSTILSIIFGILVGILAAVIATFILRRPVVHAGQTAIVSVKISSKDKTGKIILDENGTEVDALPEGFRSIKKGSPVVVTSYVNGKAIVKKISKKSTKIYEYLH